MHRKAIQHLRRCDPTLARVIEQVGPCGFEARVEGSHFDAIVRAIVYQQLSGSAAFTIHSRLLNLYGGTPPLPAQLAATPDETLRGVGLSRQKIAYLRDLAARADSGALPVLRLHELEDAAVVEALTQVKGVGVWTAQMFLMFRLARPDVLPDLDLGIRKAIQRAYGLRKLPTVERIHRIGEKWQPYRTIASWYLWRSLDQKGAAGTPASRRQGGAPSGASRRKPIARERVAREAVSGTRAPREGTARQRVTGKRAPRKRVTRKR
ncbi:MAG: DNA-3-methyladenine glycosylase family protein [Gemmatimonadaceae bacterium]